VVAMVTNARGSGGRAALTAAVLTLLGAAVATGAGVGAVLGLTGGAVGSSLRGTYGLAAVGLVAAGALAWRRPWQLDRETAASWLYHRDLRVAAYNGALLGAGFTTRLGYWLWYALPVGAFASGSAVTGAVLFAVYAATRILLSLLLAALALVRPPIQVRVLSLASPLRAATDGLLLVGVGSLTATAILA
jgi:hypothetical protein